MYLQLVFISVLPLLFDVCNGASQELKDEEATTQISQGKAMDYSMEDETTEEDYDNQVGEQNRLSELWR